MDPDANLREQFELATRIQAAADNPEQHPMHGGTPSDDAARLAELVLALDEWITKGGFLPERWRKP